MCSRLIQPIHLIGQESSKIRNIQFLVREPHHKIVEIV